MKYTKKFDFWLGIISRCLIVIGCVLIVWSLSGCSQMTPLEREDYEYRQRMLDEEKDRCRYPKVWDGNTQTCKVWYG